MAETLSKRQIKFWRGEMELLDRLYRDRQQEWQKLIDLYDLKFNEQIRDLDPSELIRVPRFYPLVRQIVATIAYNYPKLFFTVEDDEGDGAEIGDILERAAMAFLRLTNAKPHIHQAIFDALFCGVGWLRLDYNPPGDDLIPPYVANDAMAEDLVAVNRVPPGFVHIDPQTPPHQLGHARYIRERMWLPLKQLKDDPTIRNRHQIKPTSIDHRDLPLGEPMSERSETADQRAVRESIENGEFVLVDRVHDRIGRQQIMFAEGLDDPIQQIEHPFAKMNFAMRMDMFGQPMVDEQGQPMLDLENGEPATGWLVKGGFPFVPIKFDISAHSYYPVPHMEYVKDLQMGITEAVSRLSAILKRTARQGLASQAEIDNNPNLLDHLRRGVDGEWHSVLDPNNFRELNYGNLPPDQYSLLNILQQIESEVTRVNELGQDGGEEARTATEAGLIAASASINREWLEASVAGVYEDVVRGAFTIMGDPRYTPESFQVNVAPDGEQRMSRALQSADFLWNYRINVQAGSTRPLFEQLQRQQAVDFWDRASQRANFDQMELDKFLASSYDVVDPEKLLVDDINEEAERAVQLENDFMVRNLQDPGVVTGQDHQAHMDTHGAYQQHPMYAQLMQQAQATDLYGNPANPQAAQRLQMIDQLVQQHVQQHQAIMDQEEGKATQPGGPAMAGQTPITSIRSQMQSNAQNIAHQATAEAQNLTDGA